MDFFTGVTATAHTGRMGVLVAHGADEWTQVIRESFVPLSMGAISSTFTGSVLSSALGPALTLSAVSTHGHHVATRTSRLVRTEPRDDFLFSLHLNGEGAVVQDGRKAVLARGDGVLYDSARPYELLFPTGTRQFVLQIPRHQLCDRVGRVQDMCARALPSGHPAVRVLPIYLSPEGIVGKDCCTIRRRTAGAMRIGLLPEVSKTIVGKIDIIY